MKIFGFIIVKESEHKKAQDSLAQRVELQVQKDALLSRVKDLETENRTLKSAKPFIDVKLGDPSPTDYLKRKSYVAQVAGLHKDILEPKLKQMVSAAHTLLEDENNSRELDQALKGAVYAFWEILRWGQSMVNEQLGNQIAEVAPKENNK